MPGVSLHFIAGCILSVIGRYYYRTYFEGEQKIQRMVFLVFICVVLSIIPDVFLGTYYSAHILSFDTLLPYQVFMHYVFIPLGILFLGLLAFRFDIVRKPLWSMGVCALLLHFLMDLFLQEAGWFI